MVLSQMDAGKALTAAAAKGNTGEVQRILEECRVHPDTLNEFGRTGLQVRSAWQKGGFNDTRYLVLTQQLNLVA